MGKAQDILEWTNTLTLLLTSGLNIQDAVSLTKSLHEDSTLTPVLNRIDEKLKKGMPFSQCLREEKHFSSLYAELVGIGEKIGDLTLVFRQLTSYLSENRKVQDKLRSALIYPAILIFLIASGIVGLVFFFIPRLQENLSFNPELAAELTQSLRQGKLILIVFLILLIVLIVIVIIMRLLVRSNSTIALSIYHIILNIPVIGDVMMKREMFNLFYALSLLTRCRIPLEESIRLSTMVLSNVYLRWRIAHIRRSLFKGESLSRIFRMERIFPSHISQWIGVGERIGKMEEVFSQLENFYKQEMEKITDRIMALIEPVTSLIIGVIILIVVLTLIVPLMTIYGGLV